MDEDDPVVHEIDVFLSKSLADSLYVFQYPVRPATAPYEDIAHTSARVKPKQKKVELELAINTSSVNYAQSKGEQIALNVDGTFGVSGTPHFNSDKMDKQVLTSTTSAMDHAQYAVGILKDSELHLTPVHGMIQLRPSFGYMDKVDQKTKEQTGDAADNSQDEAEVEEAKPVLVKFARAESAEAKARRLASFDHLQKTRQNEPWVDVRVYSDPADSECERERANLLCSRCTEETLFTASPDEYLHMLLPEATNLEEEKPDLPDNVLSLAQLKFMNLADQVKALFVSAKVLQFSQLLSLLPKGIDHNAALKAVQQVAMLVQGCWVVKSEVLHPKDTFSPHSGVPADILCRGRDYMMWKFRQSRFVVRKDITSVVKLPADDVKAILEQMSRLRVKQGWEFVFDFDKAFTDRYPEVVERQEKVWELKYQQLSRNLTSGICEDDHEMKQCDKPKRRRTTSRSRTKSSDRSDISDTDTEKIHKKSDQKVCKRSRSHSGSAGGSSSVGDDGSDTTANNVSESPSTADCLSNGSIETSAPASTELKLELMKFMSDKLRSRMVLSLSELKKLFSLRLMECPPGHVLGSGVSTKLLEQTVMEAGGQKLGDKWPASAPAEPVFVLPKLGDKYDQYRGLLVSMFTTHHRIKSVAFKKRIEEEFNTTLTDSEIKKLQKDYCVTKGLMWYLKGTEP